MAHIYDDPPASHSPARKAAAADIRKALEVFDHDALDSAIVRLREAIAAEVTAKRAAAGAPVVVAEGISQAAGGGWVATTPEAALSKAAQAATAPATSIPRVARTADHEAAVTKAAAAPGVDLAKLKGDGWGGVHPMHEPGPDMSPATPAERRQGAQSQPPASWTAAEVGATLAEALGARRKYADDANLPAGMSRALADQIRSDPPKVDLLDMGDPRLKGGYMVTPKPPEANDGPGRSRSK